MAMKSHRPLAFIMASCCPGLAWSIEPQHIDLWGLDFTPQLQVQESYDDNFRELEHNVQSSAVTRIAPGFELKAEDRNSATRLTWEPTRVIYSDEPNASWTGQRLRADSIMEFTDRHRLEVDAEVHKYERTNSTAVDGINDKIRNAHVGGLYTYGAKSAANQLELGLNYDQLRYENSDGINDDKERNTTGLTGTWYHRIGSNTRGLLEYDHTLFDYQQSGNPRSSKTDAVLAGAVWDFTARTSGKVRVGYERKQFDDNSVGDLNNPMWQVDLQWKPRTYSVFTLVARQASAEGDDGANAIKATNLRLGWRHGWTPRITTVAEAGAGRYIYEGQDRTDQLRDYHLGVIYSMRRWLDVEVGYRYRNDDSNADEQSFTRNIYQISFTASL